MIMFCTDTHHQLREQGIELLLLVIQDLTIKQEASIRLFGITEDITDSGLTIHLYLDSQVDIQGATHHRILCLAVPITG